MGETERGSTLLERVLQVEVEAPLTGTWGRWGPGL